MGKYIVLLVFCGPLLARMVIEGQAALDEGPSMGLRTTAEEQNREQEKLRSFQDEARAVWEHLKAVGPTKGPVRPQIAKELKRVEEALVAHTKASAQAERFAISFKRGENEETWEEPVLRQALRVRRLGLELQAAYEKGNILDAQLRSYQALRGEPAYDAELIYRVKSAREWADLEKNYPGDLLVAPLRAWLDAQQSPESKTPQGNNTDMKALEMGHSEMVRYLQRHRETAVRATSQAEARERLWGDLLKLLLRIERPVPLEQIRDAAVVHEALRAVSKDKESVSAALEIYKKRCLAYLPLKRLDEKVVLRRSRTMLEVDRAKVTVRWRDKTGETPLRSALDKPGIDEFAEELKNAESIVYKNSKTDPKTGILTTETLNYDAVGPTGPSEAAHRFYNARKDADDNNWSLTAIEKMWNVCKDDARHLGTAWSNLRALRETVLRYQASGGRWVGAR